MFRLFKAFLVFSSATKRFSIKDYESGIETLLNWRAKEVERSIKREFIDDDIELLKLAAINLVESLAENGEPKIDPSTLAREIDKRLCPWTAMIMARRIAIGSLEGARNENDYVGLPMFKGHVEKIERSLVNEEFPTKLLSTQSGT